MMDQHMTYNKERMLKEGYEESTTASDQKDKKQKAPRFIWSYMIKPVRKDYEDK